MTLKAFKKAYTTDQDLNSVQDNVEESFIPLLRNPLVDGLILENIVLVTGQDNVINHKLGRQLQGWIVVGKNAAADIYDNQSNNSLTNLTLYLRTTANCTIKLYVF